MEHAPSDADLLARARTHPEILGVLYERHATAVHRYLSRRVGPGPADDLLGDVFVAAVEARMRVRPHPSGSALPWLYGIAANVVRSHLRRRAATSPSVTRFVDDLDWTPSTTGWTLSPGAASCGPRSASSAPRTAS